MPPPVTHDLARRIDDAITAHMELRLDMGMALPGNPGGIEVQYFGHAMASLARHVPFPYMNLVRRFRAVDIDQLDAIADFYGDLDFGIEVIPSDLTPEVVDRFIDLGLHMTRFDTILYGAPSSQGGDVPADLTIDSIGADRAELAQTLYLEGFEFPSADREHARRFLPCWIDDPRIDVRIASLDGEPAAMGILFTHDRLSYFAGGATLPPLRRRGCQTALLSHRMALAARRGAEFVVSKTAPATNSQNNMERVGLRVAYSMGTWSKRTERRTSR
jgi:GNAT superfamily N-acetyltransferase